VGRIRSVELRHHAKFRGDRSNRCRDISILHFCRWGCRHLGLLKFQIFKDRNGPERRTSSLRQILSKSLKPWRRYVDFWIFQDGGRRHLGFVIRVSRPPTKGICWCLSLYKTWLESMK